MKSDHYLIEHGMKVPPFSHTKYPLGQLKIGASFLVEPKDAARVRTAASQFKKRNPGYNFTIRKCDDGFRLWRIK